MYRKLININFSHILEILKCSILININELISILTLLVITTIVSSYSTKGLYIFGLIFPLQYLLSSINEAIKIAIYQITITYGLQILLKLNNLVFVLHFMITLSLVICFLLNIQYIVMFFNIPEKYINVFSIFSLWYLLSNFLKSIFETFISILVILNNKKLVYILITVSSITRIVFTYIFCAIYQFDLYSYIIGLLISLIICGSLAIQFFFRSNLKLSNLSISYQQLTKKIIVTVGPILLKHLIVFMSSTVANYILSNFGTDMLSGFNLVTRIKQLYIIPATSIGTSVAIVFLSKRKQLTIKDILIVSMIMCIVLYTIIGTVLYITQDKILALFSSDKNVILSAKLYLMFCIYSILSFSCCMMFLSILEVIGMAKVSTKITILINIFITVIGWYWTKSSGNIQSYYYTILIVYSIAFIYMVIHIYTTKLDLASL